jgi:hypothetical protein
MYYMHKDKGVDLKKKRFNFIVTEVILQANLIISRTVHMQLSAVYAMKQVDLSDDALMCIGIRLEPRPRHRTY